MSAEEEKTPYDRFLNALSQLTQDQTLYETELIKTDELQGEQHAEIIRMGNMLCKRLQKFAEKGQTFAQSLPPDFLPKIMDTVDSYQTLIVPPKVCGGFCPCLKPARDGPEYEKKLLLTKAKMVSIIFLTQAALIENKGEEHNMDSMHYADYVNKMNIVFNSLDEIKVTNGTEKALNSYRKKLLTAVEAVDRFIQHFGESGGKKEFKAEAVRRIKSVQDMLNTRQTSPEGVLLPIGRRILIKSQSTLQEIMNSAAAIALTQAKENLNNIDSLVKLLKKSRDFEIAQFDVMEEKMAERNLMDSLSRLREDCEIVHSDASSKLRDAAKRWNTVKSGAQPRKVAEYIEEVEQPVLPAINPDIDPQKLLHNTAKHLGKVGTIANKMKAGVAGVAGEVVKGVKTGADGAKSAVTNSAAAAKTAASKAFTGEEGPLSPKEAGKKPKQNMFNPLEALLGPDHDNAGGSKKQSGGFGGMFVDL